MILLLHPAAINGTDHSLLILLNDHECHALTIPINPVGIVSSTTIQVISNIDSLFTVTV